MYKSREELISTIEILDSDIKRIEARRQEVYEELLFAICPYKIGDTVDIKGYSFTGKSGIVTNLRIKRDDYGNKTKIVYIVHAIVLKKDGTKSLNSVDWTEF